MRIVIYGDIGGSGGYVRYCKGLLGYNAIPKNVEVWFITTLQFYEKLTPLDSNIHIITHSWLISKFRLKRYLWYLWVYPNLVRKIKPDVEFYPLGQRRVYLRKPLTITTCHNLLLFDKKELNSIEDIIERRYFQRYRNNQSKYFKKSSAVIFLSNHSKELVCKEVPNIKESTVISHGLDPVFLLPQKRSYELGDNIRLLYVSPFYNYKHQKEVVQAVKLLRESLGLNLCLKLIGGGDSTASAQLKQFVKYENSQEYVMLSGPMNYEFLIQEYTSADIFIFASSCETFGITILEAMGSRLPIACSDRTGLSEILKDAGVYFDPDDPGSIANAIRTLITDSNLREILGERAYQYSKEYKWERCASETFNYIKYIARKDE